jgi:hypothetical protein
MLGKVMPIEMVYEVYEDEGSGKASLVKKGKYQPHSELLPAG